MVRKAQVKVVQREMTTNEFAKIAKVTPGTVSGYCRRIDNGEFKVLKALREWGLVSVKRLPNNSWSLRVKVKEKK